LRGDAIHSAGSVEEYFLKVVSKEGVIAWDSMRTGDYALDHGLDDAKRGRMTASNGGYLDIHR